MATTLAQGTSAVQEAVRSPRDPAAVNAVIAALAAQFGNRLVTSQAVREQHANTTTWIENEAPDAVVFPQTTADVQAIVRICAAQARTIACTSAVVCGNTTASGAWFSIQVVVLACCSRTAWEVTSRLPNCAVSAATTAAIASRLRAIRTGFSCTNVIATRSFNRPADTW